MQPRHIKRSLSYEFQEKNRSVQALDHLEPDVRFVAHRWPVPGMDWEDVEQELRLQIWRKLHLYDPKKASLRAWAGIVMRNRMADIAAFDRPARALDFSCELPDWL